MEMDIRSRGCAVCTWGEEAVARQAHRPLLRLPCPVPQISRSKTWEGLVTVYQLMRTSPKNMALIRGATVNIVTSRPPWPRYSALSPYCRFGRWRSWIEKR